MTITSLLHERIESVCPISGVSLGSHNDKSTWRINFRPEATPVQRAAAQTVLDAFDVATEEQKFLKAEGDKRVFKANLLAQPNKTVTIQDLLDLGLL